MSEFSVLLSSSSSSFFIISVQITHEPLMNMEIFLLDFAFLLHTRLWPLLLPLFNTVLGRETHEFAFIDCWIKVMKSGGSVDHHMHGQNIQWREQANSASKRKRVRDQSRQTRYIQSPLLAPKTKLNNSITPGAYLYKFGTTSSLDLNRILARTLHRARTHMFFFIYVLVNFFISIFMVLTKFSCM